MKKILAVIFFLAIMISGLNAVQTQYKTFETKDDFIKGVFDGLAVSFEGKISPWFKFSEFDDKKKLGKEIWDVCLTESDKELYCASSSPASIIKFIKNNGNYIFDSVININADKITSINKLFYDIDAKSVVYSVIPEPALYIYPEKLLCSLPENYIYDIIKYKEYYYVSTGSNGKIYKIDKNGKYELFYKIKDNDCLSLNIYNDRILAGGSSTGYLYSIPSDNPESAEILENFGDAEIKKIIVKNNKIFAAVNNFRSGSPQFPGNMQIPEQEITEPEESESLEFFGDINEDIFDNSEQQQQQEQIIQKIKNKSDKINRFQKNNYKSGTIYEVGESYKISIAEFKNDFILDFQIDNNNNFYSVSGKNNSVYKVSGKDYYLIFKNKSGKLQKICFDLSGQPSFIAVSNPSKLYEPNHSEKIFEYISDIIDLGYKASAGTPEIEYSGKIEYTFRTGNTNKINDLWTEWNSSSNSRENRYFQYKIKFLTESSELKKITVPYTQLNLKPIIKSINISSLSNKPKDSKSRQSSRQSSRIQQASHPNMMNEEMVMEAVESFQNQQQVQPNFQMNASNSYNIRWSVSDPNGDKLLHDIFYKYESGDWVKLKFDKHYTKNYYNWNTLYFPDGKYIFKVISTDILDNPSDPLSDEIISEEIILDNTEPDVKIDNSKEKISITASDEYNIIKSCEYSINSSDWKKLYPIDNIFDSKTEKFILNSERLSGSTVTFKISDFNENVKTKGIIIK